MTNAPAIVVRDLHKSFGAQQVLNGIQLNVAHGETVAMMGRSGTGKSVFLKLLIGLQHADSGSICIDGEEITGLEGEQLNGVRKKMGFLFQQAALYDSLTVAQNVDFPLSRHTDLNTKDRENKVRELLASVGMSDALEKMPSQISGGMQKRAGLARALALDPAIVLLDEPTSGLDPVTSAEIGELISKLQKERNVATIVVTHDLPGARRFTNRFIMVDRGNILVDGTVEDLKKSDNKFVSQFLKDADQK